MKEENQNVKGREMTEEQIDFRALLFKYIIHWPWFVGAVIVCLISAYIYLVIFTVIEVYALTAMANLLVKFDNGTNRGFIFGSSRLLLSIATVIVMNLVPHLFLL